MVSVLASFLAALIVAGLSTPVVRALALRLQVVDEPTARRMHTRRIPRLGGVAIVAAFFLPLGLLFAVDTVTARLLFERPELVGGMAVGGAIVVVLGAFDDVAGVAAKNKLAIQSLAAVVAYGAGFRINAIYLPGFGVVEMGVLALPATWLWITAVVNALNLIDGLDGLAAGVALFACITNFVAAYLSGNVLICLFAATLAGAVLGFLLYNFNPATIFMGDSGSMFLGFVLATMSLFGAGAYKGTTAIALIAPIAALGVPILDMLVTIVRRFLARRSIFSPDRGHIHHRLVDAGLTHRRAVLILYGLCLAFTAVALAVHLGRSWQLGLSLTLLIACVFGVTRFLGGFNRALERSGRRVVALAPDAERLRRTVPALLVSLSSSSSSDEIERALQHFQESAGLLRIRIASSNTDHEWLHFAPDSLSDKALLEAVSTSFSVEQRSGDPIVLEFRWDCADGEVSPQCRILLQLVSDSVERALSNLSRPSLVTECQEPATAEGESRLLLAGQE